jgi:hypothetical protein
MASTAFINELRSRLRETRRRLGPFTGGPARSNEPWAVNMVELARRLDETIQVLDLYFENLPRP